MPKVWVPDIGVELLSVKPEYQPPSSPRKLKFEIYSSSGNIEQSGSLMKC